MFSYRTDIAECIIHTEIRDWFKKLINETFGPDVQVRYLSNNDHFNVFTYIEISGSESLIRQAVEFIISTSEISNYKMPWISENSYYIQGESEERVLETLQTLKNSSTHIDYVCEMYNIIGISLKVINFQPHLDDALKMLLEKIFRLVASPTPLFIMYPKTTTPVNLSSIHKPINILTVFHGEFLSYLSLEDILSLEIANKIQYDDSYHDIDLNHDIEKYYRTNLSFLNGEATTDKIDLISFRINEVLTYFIHKYHSHFVKYFIPNILTAEELRSLTRSYNIEFVYHNIIHIDFRPTNEAEKVDFCAIYHMDTSKSPFYNYDPKYATQNYSINFNADNSLDPLDCTSEFSMFVVKSQANCSPQKLNSILQYVTEQFSARQPNSILVLYEFDLNQVSKQIISSLVQMMHRGFLVFCEMNFSSKTLIEILDQADHNRIEFRKCCITIENAEIISKYSKCCELEFCGMDIDVNLFYILNNYKRLAIKNCRILSTSSDFPINLNISNNMNISFIHTNLDTSTLLKLLNCVQFVREIIFTDCNLTSCDLLDSRYFTSRNPIYFINMIFEIEDLFQIFEYCKIQNQICFQSCHFRCVNNSNYKSSLNQVKVIFQNISFDLLILLKILETLHAESEVYITQSWISANLNTFSKLTPYIKIKRILFINCRFEMVTLLRILRKVSEHAEVIIISCDLLPSIVTNSRFSVNISKLVFSDIRFNPQEFFAVLEHLKENSTIQFNKCEITTGSGDFSKFSLANKIKINLYDMSIDSQIARPLLQTDSVILFDDCCLNFITENNPNITIQAASIIFRNMTFELSEILKYSANFTPKTKIHFILCDLTVTNSLIPNIEIQPNAIIFESMLFDLELLVKFMERISEQTTLVMNRCNIQLPRVFSIRPIKILTIYFEDMNLEIETILRILKNFSNYPQIHINSCQILCSNPNELSNLNLKSNVVVVAFHNMNMDIQNFQIFLLKCTNRTTIYLNGCKIRPRDNILSIVSVDMDRLVFVNINYSSDLLQILQYVNGQFIVEFHGDLSNEAIIEICTKTPVHGKRLWLATQICPKSFCFELFAEYFRQRVLNFQINKETEYDPPTFLIPYISSVFDVSEHYWSEFKIKVVPVNDTSLKLEFLRNGLPIDLFYELNDLPDDSYVCVVDYF